MTYSIGTIIYWIIILLIFIVFLLILKKLNVKNKKLGIFIFIIIAYVIYMVLSLFNIDNFFMTFSTPEKAFKYQYNKKIDKVIDGKNTSLVISKDDAIYVYPKYNNSYKLPTGIITKVKQAYSNGVEIQILTYKNTGDYYAVISSTNQSFIHISDNISSEFYERKFYDINEYYAYLKGYNSNYSVVLDDKVIMIK